jgi:hypothetical protein
LGFQKGKSEINDHSIESIAMKGRNILLGGSYGS